MAPTDSPKWIYVLEEDFEWNTGTPFTFPAMAFFDRTGVKRLELLPNGSIRVLKGYAWDGCSPKFFLFDIVIGTPDGIPHLRTTKPKTYYASLVHDVLYQFLGTGLPLDRADADRVFFKIMNEHSFAPGKVYYWVVRCFGGLFKYMVKRARWESGYRVMLQ